jgi:DNA-binding transcriptional LysR family regulator
MTKIMNTPLDSELLRTFLAVAETGNFTKAATSVYRTQSAVSMQIKRLEEGIGAALFMRGSRGVELTRKGEQLLDNARRIVSLLDETAASMSSPPLTGRVRIGIPEEWGYAMLSRALGTFAKAHPGVEISARYGSSTKNMRELSSDDLDIAVVFEWQDFSDGEILMTDPTVWVTSDAHALHEQRPLPLALYENSGWCMDFALKSLNTLGLPYRVAYQSDTSGGLKIAVASGLAIAPISRSNIPEGCRELTADEGFGNIDASNVVMHRNARSQGDVIDGMARAIRDAFSAVS